MFRSVSGERDRESLSPEGRESDDRWRSRPRAAATDKWFRLTYKSLYLNACEAVAEFIGASKGEVVLMENASTAVNVVLLSLNLGLKDCILSTTVCFKGCKIAIDVICKATGARSCYLNLKLPVTSKESVVRLFSDYLDQNPTVTFALVDHIPCACSVLFPVKEIVRVCHQKGVRVMIDGAPGPGQLRLDIKDIGADYYTGTPWRVDRYISAHDYVRSPDNFRSIFTRDRPRVHIHGQTVRATRAAMSATSSETKKRSVLKSTVDRWIVDNDKALSTTVWLKYDTDPADRTRVVTLKCSVCAKFVDRLVGMRNYNPAFVEGSGNLRASSFKDHAASDMHSRAMLLLKKEVRPSFNLD